MVKEALITRYHQGVPLFRMKAELLSPWKSPPRFEMQAMVNEDTVCFGLVSIAFPLLIVSWS